MTQFPKMILLRKIVCYPTKYPGINLIHDQDLGWYLESRKDNTLRRFFGQTCPSEEDEARFLPIILGQERNPQAD